MDRFWCIALFLAIHQMRNPVEATAKLSVDLLSYTSEVRCDVFALCNYKFSVCVDDAFSNSDAYDKCKYKGPLNTGALGPSPVNFPVHSDPAITAIAIPMDNWPGAVKLKVQVWDEDWLSDDDAMEFLMSNIHLGVGSPLRVEMKSESSLLTAMVTVTCDDRYYGDDCTIFCDDSTGRFACDSQTGNKICFEGWTGDSCNEAVTKPSSQSTMTPTTAIPTTKSPITTTTETTPTTTTVKSTTTEVHSSTQGHIDYFETESTIQASSMSPKQPVTEEATTEEQTTPTSKPSSTTTPPNNRQSSKTEHTGEIDITTVINASTNSSSENVTTSEDTTQSPNNSDDEDKEVKVPPTPKVTKLTTETTSSGITKTRWSSDYEDSLIPFGTTQESQRAPFTVNGFLSFQNPLFLSVIVIVVLATLVVVAYGIWRARRSESCNLKSPRALINEDSTNEAIYQEVGPAVLSNGHAKENPVFEKDIP